MKRPKTIFGYYSFLFLFIAITAIPAQAVSRFLDNGDNTITDTASGLMWQKNTPSPIVSPAVNWFEAIRMCEDLVLGGYNDWRLPTKDEWETIIDRNNQYPALVYPNPFGNVIVNSPYWTASEYSYGPDYTCDSSGCPLKSYVVLLYLGFIGYQNKNSLAFVWPVRSENTESSPQEVLKIHRRVPDKVAHKGPKIDKSPRLKSISVILFKPEILSEKVRLLGIDINESPDQDGYIKTALAENSKVVIKSKEDDIEIAMSIYQIDQRRVALFNNHAMMIGLPVRMRIDKDLNTLIFFQDAE
ncbi:MAG: DUF1566 domain-containing protein [Deltaproteobacteria bacterium]|nr:DUF1566 domain-containing protein [Deltaproteobacteria bacterium]